MVFTDSRGAGQEHGAGPAVWRVRTRNGMADAIDSAVCDLVGLGRAVVLELYLAKGVLLDPEVPDDTA